ncbi:hypothetical protein N7463_007504 [Penicillium fimorum]|uniref:Uncharacterized protein n=1 Tax=Penicillium fimorum TaxID=1882269 RepID=A0A9W9XY12_9EURO|nr:hypothetical protein N7463_007504 [Penicillium fimorum]
MEGEKGGMGVGKKRITVERRTAGYIDGGRRETGGARRQIQIGASVGRQTRCGRAKPKVDGRDPQSGGGPKALTPKDGGAETGGGPANRNSTGPSPGLNRGPRAILLWVNPKRESYH